MAITPRVLEKALLLKEKQNWLSSVAWLALLLALIAFPLFEPPVFYVRLIGTVLLFVVLSESWNITGGYAGYISFGHVTFFGIGAYVGALLFLWLGMPPYIAALPAGIFAAMFAVIVGYPTMRLRGPYFAIATLALGFVVQLAVGNLPFTGGGEGLVLRGGMPFQRYALEEAFYFSYLLIAAVTTGTVIFIDRSKFGYGLRAIRDDQDAALSVGVNATRLKLLAFAVSSFFAGAVGAIYAHQVAYVSAPDVFTLDISIKSLVYAVVGGTSTVLGPIVGSLFMETLDIFLTTSALGALRVDHIVFGVLLAAVVLLAPRGMVGSPRQFRRRRV
jgi:branched-chain amino acid transport system permease protein